MNINNLYQSVDYKHNHKVSQISAILAKKLGYPPFEQGVIEQAALYHDLGKDMIPSQILNKPGELTPEEFEIVKCHVSAGHQRLMDAAGFLKIAAITAREHHEKIDGSGYIGLSGDEIHPYSKLISVADVFDALLSVRVYKQAWALNEVQSFFYEQSGKQFESKVVQALMIALDDVMYLYA